MSALPPFPVATGAGPATPPALAALGLRLRPATMADLPGLRRVYADTRADELAQVPWPPGLRQAFLNQQFDLQHTHYLQHYGDADFLVVERDGEVLGRLYLQRKAPEHLVVDISLRESLRGQGVGSALLAQAQAAAVAQGCGVFLHVRRENGAARRLYLRLGFLPAGGTDMHERMAWRPSAS